MGGEGCGVSANSRPPTPPEFLRDRVSQTERLHIRFCIDFLVQNAFRRSRTSTFGRVTEAKRKKNNYSSFVVSLNSTTGRFKKKSQIDLRELINV